MQYKMFIFFFFSCQSFGRKCEDNLDALFQLVSYNVFISYLTCCLSMHAYNLPNIHNLFYVNVFYPWIFYFFSSSFVLYQINSIIDPGNHKHLHLYFIPNTYHLLSIDVFYP